MGLDLSFAKRKGSPRVQPGERIYAIGDVHGRYDLLRALLLKIEEHSAALPLARSEHVIFLGDIVDRGSDSAKVMELLYNLQQQDDQVIVLLGNHEELMLKALEGNVTAMAMWLREGGRQTLESFGVTAPDEVRDTRQLVTKINAAVPAALLQWLRRLPLIARSGDYFFCHAGVRPGVALKRQQRSDLLWIREEFLSHDGDHGAVVVHGHSVSPNVELRENRIGIDTGAYRTGVLTAVHLEEDRVDFIDTDNDSRTAKLAGTGLPARFQSGR